MNILLAEDDQNVAMIMQICLEKIGGHSVTWAEDGELALQAALNSNFDLIILDGMMPRRPGLEVARELKKQGSQTPVIFLSAKSDEKGFSEFGVGFIPKPFEPTLICGKIDSILLSASLKSGSGAA
jgi:two-component system response regulator ResD